MRGSNRTCMLFSLQLCAAAIHALTKPRPLVRRILVLDRFMPASSPKHSQFEAFGIFAVAVLAANCLLGLPVELMAVGMWLVR